MGLFAVYCKVTTSYKGKRQYSQTKKSEALKVSRIMRLFAVHCEVTTSYRGKSQYSQTKNSYVCLSYKDYEVLCCKL